MYGRQNYAANHRDRAEQVLAALSQSSNRADAAATAAPRRKPGCIVSFFVAIAKFAPPLTVACFSFCSPYPLVQLAIVQFVACILMWCRWKRFSDQQEPPTLEPASAISLSTREGLLRIHGENSRTIPLSTVRAFRVAVSKQNILADISGCLLWTFFPLFAIISFIFRRFLASTYHELEVVTLGEPLVLPGFKTAHIAESIASLLNDELQEWRLPSDTSAPLDIFDMNAEACSGSTSTISSHMTLPSQLGYRDRFAVHAVGHLQLRCSRRRSSLMLMVATCAMLLVLNLVVSVRFNDYGADAYIELFKTTKISIGALASFMVFIICAGLFAFWWTQIFMKSIGRMESLKFVYNATANWLWPLDRILAECTGRFFINVHEVSAIEAFRKPVRTTEEICRRGDRETTMLFAQDTGCVCFAMAGRLAFQIDKLYEDEALYLASSLRSTFPLI